MRVNDINSNIGLNFTRAIEIRSNTNPEGFSERIDDATMNVIRAIEKKPSIYDTETSRKIGSFLRAQIGDLNKKCTNIYPRRVAGHIYLFTGEEAQKARRLDIDAKKEIEKLGESCRAEILFERDRQLLELTEDGGYYSNEGETGYKPVSRIKLNISKNGRLKDAEYLCITEKDGKRTIEDKKLSL